MSIVSRLLVCMVGVALLMAHSTASAQFNPLLRWVPNDANSLVMVRVEKIFKSDIAQQQRWVKTYNAAYQAGMELLPSSTKQFIIASQIDFEYMEPLWTASIYEKSGAPVDISKLSQRVGGNIAKLLNFDAVSLRSDVFLVKLGDGMLASYSPANRQTTIRWLQRQMGGSYTLSPYLDEAAKFADENADIIVAFDLENVISPERIKERMANFESAKGLDPDTVVDIISSLRGVTLGITVKSAITGSIKIDFSKEPTALKSKAKEILLEVLDHNGLAIDDFASWNLTQTGSHFYLAGPLSTEGLRKIHLLINHPVKDAVGFGGSEGSEGAPEVTMATRTKQYYDSVNSIIEEFRKKPESKRLETYATWFDKYAREIDNISVVNVDPALISHGQMVSERFREIAVGLRSSDATRLANRANYQDYGYAYRYGRYGSYSGYYDNSVNRTNISAQARKEGTNAAREVVEEIANETARVRKELSQKYQMDF